MEYQLTFTLVIAGILAGAVNFFVNYLSIPFLVSKSSLTDDDWPRPKTLWLAILGYLIVGIAGAFLTPLLNVLVGLKGYYPNKDYLVTLGYGLIFGYSTTRLLVGILDSVLKKISKIEDKANQFNKVFNVNQNKLTYLNDLRKGEHYPNDKSEIEACGRATIRIIRDDVEFKKLMTNNNVDIVFKDEEKTGADRMMNTNLFKAMNTLASKVRAEWPDKFLRVTEAWDENNEHGNNSLHYEARAADINLSNKQGTIIDTSHLGRLSALAIDSGFDWVFYEDESHVHVSCKK